MHDPLPHLRPGARLDPEVVDLVRREVVEVHLEGEMTWLNPLGRRVALGGKEGGGWSLWPCALHGWLDMVMQPTRAWKERPPRRDRQPQAASLRGRSPFSPFFAE